MPKAKKRVIRKRTVRKPVAPSPYLKHQEHVLGDWLDGYYEGLCGKLMQPEKGHDRASWLAGYAEGAGHDKAGEVLRSAGLRDRLDNHYESIGRSSWCSGFMVGVRLGAERGWKKS